MLRKLKIIVSVFLLFSLVITAVAGCLPFRSSEAADGYKAIIPSVLQVGLPQAISVALFRDNQPVSGQVELTLSKDGQKVFGITDKVFGNDKIQFTMPYLPEGNYEISLIGDNFSDKTVVRIENKYLVFLETDKPIYKPGQDILMRVFTLNSDLLPVSVDITVEVIDAKGIKIFRSIVTTDDYGMAGLELPVSSQPNLGTWKITAASHQGNFQLDVRVEEYVLPKYEVNVDLPSEWFLVSESVAGEVTAAYTFGKPVLGEVEIAAWRYVGTWELYNTFSSPIDGSVAFTLPAVNYVAGVAGAGGNGNVRLDITVTENATGYVQQTCRLLTISESSLNVHIIPSGVVFKPGLPFNFLVVTQTPDNQLVDSQVAVSISYYDKDFKNIKTDKESVTTVKGKALVEMTPPQNVIAFTINCDARGTSTSKTLQSGHSPSGNFIHLEQITEGTPSIGSEIRFCVYATQQARTFYYEVISRGKVVFSDYTSNKEIVFQVTPQMGPSAKLLVYQILPNSEVAADYLPFDVIADYPQDVQVGFSDAQPAPGDEISVAVQTQGEAAVGIVAVDKSVFILAENRMNLQQVFDKLEQLYMDPQVEIHEVSIYDGIKTLGAAEIFKNAGVVVLSNHKVPEGKDYEMAVRAQGIGGFWDGLFGLGQKAAFDNAIMESAPAVVPTTATPVLQDGSTLTEVDRIRQYFPETWLWQRITSGTDGGASVRVTVPDSITTWVLRAIAISRTYGLGVAEAELTVFQPFFLTVDLPYSAIRGEEFPVNIAVYNYLDEPQTVQVEIESAGWFDLLDRSQKMVTVKANDIGSVAFLIRPEALGNNDIKITARSPQKADAVIKPLLVEAEGVSHEVVSNLVLSPGTRNAVTDIPVGAVVGSGTAFFSATAGYLTQTMEGLEKLIQMPFGCGEQNMIVFAPDVLITEYLKASGTLKPEIMAKAEKLMITGYQRQLTYRRTDGSFSAFGMDDKEGSLWLTAFVLKSFNHARDLIYIDDSVLTEAQSWITSHQAADGSFDVVGFVHHQEMVGGMNNKTALTAYVAIALLQSGEKNASGRAVAYLEGAVSGVTDSYTIAITAYALTLAQSSQAGIAVAKLMDLAQEDETGLYWGDTPVDTYPIPGKEAIMPFPEHRIGNKSVGIETTSYAAMALILQKDNLNAGKAAKWLISRRNAYGGYGSTQDTVVALEALTLYATSAQSDVNLTITLSAGGTVIKELKLNAANFDVLQIVALPVNETIMVKVEGTGEALGQVVRRYNMPDVTVATSRENFSIKVDYDATDVMVNDLVKVSVSLSFNPLVPMEVGMTIIDISVPTGFVAVASSLDKVLQDPVVKRYEIAGRKVIFYIDKLLTGDIISFDFGVQAQSPVKAKGVVSQAYAYYQPEISAQVLGQDMTVR